MSMIGKQQYIWRRQGSDRAHTITARDPQHAMSMLVTAARILRWSGRFEFFSHDGSAVGILDVSGKGRVRIDVARKEVAV